MRPSLYALFTFSSFQVSAVSLSKLKLELRTICSFLTATQMAVSSQYNATTKPITVGVLTLRGRFWQDPLFTTSSQIASDSASTVQQTQFIRVCHPSCVADVASCRNAVQKFENAIDSSLSTVPDTFYGGVERSMSPVSLTNGHR